LFSQLAELQSRIDRKKRIRDQAEEKLKEKIECLIRETEASSELATFLLEDIGELERDLGFEGVQSPFVWNGFPPGISLVTIDNSSGS
jgi:hypothetical protein